MALRVLQAEGLHAVVTDGGLGAVTLAGVEVLRGLTHPVRNPDWGTYLTTTLSEQADAASLLRHFADKDGLFTGVFRVSLGATRLIAEVELTFPQGGLVNRAGFTLLHPIRGVAGEALTLRHSGGHETVTTFPARISPVQPARDIVALRHRVQGVAVDIALEGDVFEMEDQRNWSDASFKTYCRPLSLPYPYRVGVGEVIRQKVTLDLHPGDEAGPLAEATGPIKSRMPQVLVAQEAGISSVTALAGFPGMPLLLRMDRKTGDDGLRAVMGREIALEIVFDDESDLHVQIARAQGLRPLRVAALPRAFLKSHQPDADWPTGVQPADALAPLRLAFPQAMVGGGSLTNFTELNRCRPEAAAVDFVTFGNTAIVHAADDLSVWQTIEALPDIFASAHAIAESKPLHLGLFSIGMRCNPYGADVAPNPAGLRLPMAMADPRQTTGFAAAYAVAVLAAAARGGVSSLALAMPDGPLGAIGPLADVLRQAHAMADHEVTLTEDHGLILLDAGSMGLAANCTEQPWQLPGLPPIAAECAAFWPA